MRRGAVVLREPVRYSLLTLVVVTLWVALAMLVWTRWEPWVLEAEVVVSDELPGQWISRFRQYEEGSAELRTSPDGTRYIYAPEYADSEGPWIEIWDIRNRSLCTLLVREHYVLGFGTDDHILFGRGGGFLDNSQYRWRVYARRHPEWWWGHFYRVEVWVLIAMTFLVAGMLRRKVLKRGPVT